MHNPHCNSLAAQFLALTIAHTLNSLSSTVGQRFKKELSSDHFIKIGKFEKGTHTVKTDPSKKGGKTSEFTIN